jgi:murein DD-endopeptidase MepM/ murein hydrolase activator NlpD
VTARGWLGLLLLLLVATAAGLTWFRAEGSPPEVGAPARVAIGAVPSAIQLELGDAGSGLREVQVVLTHARGEESLIEQRYPGNWLTGATSPLLEASLEVPVDPQRLDLAQGEAFLRVAVRDWSWRGGFRGNQTLLDVPVVIDLEPPRIAVASGLTYVRRGGSGAVSYSVSEPTARDGVRVGDALFRGFPISGADAAGAAADTQPEGTVRPAGRRFALFAVPTDAPPDPEVLVFAEDAAGNASAARWPAVVQEWVVPSAQVTLPQKFLDTQVRRIARAENIPGTDLAQVFHEINTALRRANEARIREIVTESEQKPLWRGAFAQLTNSKVTSRFAERRVYFVGGKAVSEATHFGYDLASTAAAEITAANAGRVAFAGELGIYGNAVLIDHGLGLSSLYGHLSRIDVAEAERVEKGRRLGLSGATGLAGGDHLHFALLVGETYVDPLEWWDREWVRTHIEVRLVRLAP